MKRERYCTGRKKNGLTVFFFLVCEIGSQGGWFAISRHSVLIYLFECQTRFYLKLCSTCEKNCNMLFAFVYAVRTVKLEIKNFPQQSLLSQLETRLSLETEILHDRYRTVRYGTVRYRTRTGLQILCCSLHKRCFLQYCIPKVML